MPAKASGRWCFTDTGTEGAARPFGLMGAWPTLIGARRFPFRKRIRTMMFHSRTPLAVSAALVLGSLAPAVAQQTADAVAPEAATDTTTAFGGLSQAATDALVLKGAGTPVEAEDWMVVAANPLAVEAGARVLREGGTAADALVAVQLVLGLVEPQSSGLGGGAFLVWYDADRGELTTLDGRETAPLAASPTLFQDEAGEPLSFYDAVVGGRSVGVPGTPALLEDAHARWGTAAWDSLFTEATDLAENGFEVSPR